MNHINYQDRTEWRNLHNQLHREQGPAIEYLDGSKVWYKDGNLHRENGPAVEMANGYKAWYIDGILHRKDGPAIVLGNGESYWYEYGKPVNVEKTDDSEKTKLLDFLSYCDPTGWFKEEDKQRVVNDYINHLKSLKNSK